MKQILLVDDDAFFRAMFAGMLPWGDYGYTLLQAENGREAMDMLHAHPDISIVFTDMNMPIVDGVELIRYAAEHFSGVHCVALSAYDDFAYVKSSFKSGVEDYLLKHTLTCDQLIEVLKKHAGELEQDAFGADDAQRWRFLFDFMTGAYASPAEYAPLFTALELPVLSGNLLLGVLLSDAPEGEITFRGSDDTAQSHLRTALSMLQNLIDRTGTGVAFQGPDDRRIYLMVSSPAFDSLTFAHQASLTLARQAETMMLRYFNLRTCLRCSTVCRSASALRESYLAMMNEAGQTVALEAPRQSVAIPLPDREVLEETLMFGTEDTVRQLCAKAYQNGRKMRASKADFCTLTRQYAELAKAVCTDAGIAVSLSDADMDASDAQQEEATAAHLLEIHHSLSAAAKERYSPVVYGSLCMIHQEFSNVQLSPALISNVLHANPAYLSRLFKSQVGQNMSDYLSAQRLKHACRLLEDGARSVKDIAALCGYDNYNYFFTVFKKHIGVTPKEYQNDALAGRLHAGIGRKEHP